jgi:hypothetical protein
VTSISSFSSRRLLPVLGALLVLLPAASPAAAAPAWVERSDANTQVLLEVMAHLSPEGAGRLGIPGLDESIRDLRPGFVERTREAWTKAGETLRPRLATEKDLAVRQDLQILLDTVDSNLRGLELSEKYQLPYFNLTEAVYGGLRTLLDERVEASRRPAALVRLRKYAGLEPGFTPIARLAENEIRTRLGVQGLLAPVKEEVERDLANNQTVRAGIAELFRTHGIKGYEQPLAELDKQLVAYDDFVRREILPRARTDFRQPAELYAEGLKEYGVDMPVDELVSRAEVAFREIQNEMQALAPLVAKQHGLAVTDYREVLRELKKKQLEGEAILPLYQERMRQLEEIIRREKIVTVPDRPMRVRLASAAESVGSPAPHMSPPRLIGNQGEMGEFVLPLSIPGQQGGSALKLDDFTYEALSWALTAHEGRPGHELQYSSLIENGVSKARAIFAFNSVNAEGWALYAEAEVKPFLPLDGQLAALQSRLLRAARAFLDPGLQAGTITRDEAMRILREEVVQSEGMALQEVQRYTFRSPGQATSYFLGYLRLMELRAETERILGPKFDRLAFHDFILAQGLLPPALLRQAVYDDFIPRMKK